MKLLEQRVISWLQEEGRGWETRLSIAKGLGQTKSPHLVMVLGELTDEGVLVAEFRKDRWLGTWVYMYNGDWVAPRFWNDLEEKTS